MGKPISDFYFFFSGVLRLGAAVFSQIHKRPFYYPLIVRNLYDFGVKSFFIILALGTALGGVLTFHIGVSIEKYGAKLYTPKILMVSLVGEFAPTLGSILLAGRIGAGVTAEIGAMKVTEQIDALKAMGVSYIKYVITPKVIACLIIVPVLCMWLVAIGFLTGAFVGWSRLQLDPGYFIAKGLYTPSLAFFLFSCFKTVVFALCIALIACHYGLNITKGAYEVGTAVMKSVVASLLVIILSDYGLTHFYYSFLHPQ